MWPKVYMEVHIIINIINIIIQWNLGKMVTHDLKVSSCNREVATKMCHLELELSGYN